MTTMPNFLSLTFLNDRREIPEQLAEMTGSAGARRYRHRNDLRLAWAAAGRSP